MLWKLTSLGDTALLLPLSVLVFGCLLVQRRGEAALAWAAAIVACGGLTVMAKLGFHMCGGDNGGIRSPSGHTSVSAIVYGGLAVLVASGRPTAIKAGAAFAAAVLVVAIGLSRALMGVHTLGEVVLGYLIGGSCVGLFVWMLARSGWPRITLWPLAVATVATVILLGGQQLYIEQRIVQMSRLIAGALDVCR